MTREHKPKNHMIVKQDSNGSMCCQATSTTHEWNTYTDLIVKSGKYYLKHKSFTEVSLC
jgi:hypothetical protein